MQWYAFYNEPAGGVDPPNGKKERLLKLFGHWCDKVLDLLLATPEEMILRRDIYDRIPIFKWSKGCVTLLGDSVHAMQPNMGQGGCMAIEDSYQLALELEKACKQSFETGKSVDIKAALNRYEKERRLRVAVIYGMARMAAIMASTYKPYLGVGLGPLSVFDITFFLRSSKLEGRVPSCRLSEKASDQLGRWFADDDALERALDAEWYLLPMDKTSGTTQVIQLSKDENRPSIIGTSASMDSEGVPAVISSPQVSERHACITCKDNAFFLTDLRSKHGTWITDVEGGRYRVPPNFPVRIHPSYVIEFGPDKQVAFRVKVQKAPIEENNPRQDTMLLGAL